MKLIKGLVVVFAVTLLLSCAGVNAANYLVMNEIPVPLKQGITAKVADKDESSLQYIYESDSKDKNHLFYRPVRASLMGETLDGSDCQTDFKTLPHQKWYTLGTQYVTTTGCGSFARNGKAFLLMKTEKSYDDTTFFWGQWITTEKTYNELVK